MSCYACWISASSLFLRSPPKYCLWCPPEPAGVAALAWTAAGTIIGVLCLSAVSATIDRTPAILELISQMTTMGVVLQASIGKCSRRTLSNHSSFISRGHTQKAVDRSARHIYCLPHHNAGAKAIERPARVFTFGDVVDMLNNATSVAKHAHSMRDVVGNVLRREGAGSTNLQVRILFASNLLNRFFQVRPNKSAGPFRPRLFMSQFHHDYPSLSNSVLITNHC
jgi:hypothetical protein